jgi:lysophospholipase L1-like esterase
VPIRFNGSSTTSSSTTTISAMRAGIGSGLQIIASHNADHNGSGTTTVGGASNDSHQSRFKHVMTKDIVGLVLVYINWQNETAGANQIIVSAGLESPASTFLPVTFHGAATATLDPDGYVLSDVIPVDLLTGDIVFSRTRVTFTASGTAPEIRTTISTDGEGSETGVGLASKLTSGTITAGITFAYGPAMVLGVTKNGTTAHSVAILGDSIANGQTDYAFDKSYVSRALEAAGVGYVSTATNGEAATTYAAVATSRRRRLLTGGLDTVYLAYGTNDVISAATLSTLQTRMLAIATFHANRAARVFIPTLLPLTDSTDGFITLANQTPRAVNTVRVNFNNWLRDGSPIDATTKAAVATGTTSNVLRAGGTGHPLASISSHATLSKGYVEMADVVESSRDSGKWAVTGASGTGSTTSGSNSITSVTGTGFANGQMLVAAGFTNGSFPNGYPQIDAGAGTATLTIKGVSGTAVNSSATASGVTLTSAYTGDGTHPWPAMHALLQAAFPASSLA